MDGLLSHIHLTAAQPDAFLSAWARWQQARSLWCFEMEHSPSGNFTEPSCKEARRRWLASIEELLQVRPQDGRGIAAAAHILWTEALDIHTPGCLPNDLTPDELLHRHLVLSIWQAASGRNGLPPRFHASFSKEASDKPE